MKFVFAFTLIFSSIAFASDLMPNEGNLTYAPKLNEVLELKIWPKNKNNISGFATVEFTVNESGKVANVKVIDAYPISLGFTAAKAIQQWLFTPATVDGKLVKVTNEATFHFVQK